jgi:membrane dipeptidase
VLTFDSHVDIPLTFATSQFIPATAEAQVNLQNMRSGGLDAAFFFVYTGQTPREARGYAGAQADASAKFAAIHCMVDLLRRGYNEQ